MKKTKQPGDNISLKTKKTEDPKVMNWLNAQSNLMDSLRYLIENEIHQNGVRNLQAFIPVERNVLGSSLSVQDGGMNDYASGHVHETAAAAAQTTGEVSAANPSGSARSVQSDEQQEQQMDQAAHAGPPPVKPAQKEPADAAAQMLPEPADEDEIDDDDVEAWI